MKQELYLNRRRRYGSLDTRVFMLVEDVIFNNNIYKLWFRNIIIMTSIKEIKAYYSELRDEARSASNPKTLSLIERHSRMYAQRFADSDISSSLRKKAMSEHKKTLQLTQKMRKKLK